MPMVQVCELVGALNARLRATVTPISLPHPPESCPYAGAPLVHETRTLSAPPPSTETGICGPRPRGARYRPRPSPSSAKSLGEGPAKRRSSPSAQSAYLILHNRSASRRVRPTGPNQMRRSCRCPRARSSGSSRLGRFWYGHRFAGSGGLPWCPRTCRAKVGRGRVGPAVDQWHRSTSTPVGAVPKHPARPCVQGWASVLWPRR